MKCKSAGFGAKIKSIFGGRGCMKKSHASAESISADGLTSAKKQNGCFSFIIASVVILLFFTIRAGPSQATPQDDLKTAVSSLTVQVLALKADDTAAYAKLQASIAATNQGQCALIVASVTTTKAGPVSVPLTVIPSQFLPTAIQMDILLPAGVTFVSVVAGQSAVDAGKLAQAAPITGGVRVLVFGLNQLPLAQGIAVTLNLTVGSSVAKGLYPISIVNPVGSNGAGNAIPVCVTSGILGVQ